MSFVILPENQTLTWQEHNISNEINLQSEVIHMPYNRSPNLTHSIEANPTVFWLAPVSFYVLVDLKTVKVVDVPFVLKLNVDFVLAPVGCNEHATSESW